MSLPQQHIVIKYPLCVCVYKHPYIYRDSSPALMDRDISRALTTLPHVGTGNV